MEIKKDVTVFKCDHCKKKMFVRGAMERHEKWCTMNPDNFKACVFCEHLEEIEIEYTVATHSIDPYSLGVIFDTGTQTKKAKGFLCKALNKKLYPLIVEKKDMVNRFPETFEDQEPMPNKCESAKYF